MQEQWVCRGTAKTLLEHLEHKTRERETLDQSISSQNPRLFSCTKLRSVEDELTEFKKLYTSKCNETTKLYKTMSDMELQLGKVQAGCITQYAGGGGADVADEATMMSKDKKEVVAIARRFHGDWLYAASLYVETRSQAQQLSAEVERLQELVQSLRREKEMVEVLYCQKLMVTSKSKATGMQGKAGK